MKIFILCTIFSASSGYSQRYDYKTKLENWNTGRVYLAPFMGNYYVGDYGPVCIGTRDEALRGHNGKRFANMICNRLGFGTDANEFIGTKMEYYKFMGSSGTDNTDGSCVPEYVVAGAKCKCESNNCELANCEMRDYKTQGGSCLKGKSDVYIHCTPPKKTYHGTWSEWSEVQECDRIDFFAQRYRKCQSKHAELVFCPGSWLQQIPCGQCIDPLPTNDDYNEEDSKVNLPVEDYEYSSYVSYDSTDNANSVGTRKRRELLIDNLMVPKKHADYLHPFCNCKLNTIHSLPQSRSPVVSASCAKSIELKGRKRLSGLYHATDVRINNKTIFQSGKYELLWTRNIHGHGRRRKAGWVIVRKNKIRWVNTKSSRCPTTGNWQSIRGRYFQKVKPSQ